MAEYNTEQKKLLLEFLEENHDSAYTIEEISNELKAKGASVGKSTVYRLMTRLVEEKRVQRFAGEKTVFSSPASSSMQCSTRSR